MSKITDVPKEKGDTIKIILEREFFEKKDKEEGKEEKDGKNQKKNYKVHDLYALIEITNRFDSRIHQIRDWQEWSGVIAKLTQIQENMEESEDDLELELSKEEAKFLKKYIEEFNEKDGKQTPPLSGITVRGIPKILEQLERA